MRIIFIKTKTNSEDIPYLYNLVENFFEAVNSKINKLPRKKHETSIVPRNVEIDLVNSLANDPNVLKKKSALKKNISFENASFVSLLKIFLMKTKNFINRKLKLDNNQSVKITNNCKKNNIVI